MPIQNALVVVVDRLSASYLGPYGNTWIDTPEFNRLASQSILFEFALSHSPELADAYRAYWLGATGFPEDRPAHTPLAAQLSAAGIHTALVTDDPLVHEHPLAEGFQQRLRVDQPAPRACDDLADTEMARVFAATVQMLTSLRPPFCLWMHARGLGGAWDAPYEHRQQFADEDDPMPPDIVQPPSAVLPSDYDPDELWGYARAYGGQVMVLDTCIGALLDALQHSPHADSTLLVFTSPRGFPMGEHQRVGDAEAALYGELLQISLLIRHPQGQGATLRTQSLAQPFDLWATLLAWYEQYGEQGSHQHIDLLAHFEDPPESTRAFSVAQAGEQLAIRTPQWFYRRSGDRAELYAKPDDRFEANEVLARCQDVAAEMEQLASRYLAQSPADTANEPGSGELGNLR